MKDLELRLISELLMNSCRSDREIAKKLGVSQPTVSRTKTRLEKEGYISEYTIVPDFNKIGYHLFALTFFSWRKEMGTNEMEEAVKHASQKSHSVPHNVVLIERGIGMNYNSFMASFHKDYSSYRQLINELKKSPYIDVARMESFLVNLDDKIHYRYLTFAALGQHLLETNQRNE